MDRLAPLLAGAVSVTSLVAALFFLRFWFRTRDRFFLLFSLAFAIYAASQFVLGIADVSEFEPYFYLPRLVTFGLIVMAVVDKNRAAR
ncbi:MAG TPA: DUF5985 family protein [Rhizomicrobium sp.]|nr:DUF5985 family protein [Rhizomicrobium sp.]